MRMKLSTAAALVVAMMLAPAATAGTATGTIVFSDTFGGSGIYTRAADGSGPVHLVDEFGAWGARWAPDGSGVAFHTFARSGSRRIEWIDADGSDRRLLVGPNELPDGWRVFSHTWSPDGRRLVACLENRRRRAVKLFSIARNGSEVLPISPSTCYPDWSWSQDRVAAIRQGMLVTMDPDGSNVTVLTRALRSPRWSPDGSRIAYERLGTEALSDIFVIDADGTDRTALTSSARNDWSPEWSPAGDEIVWAREDRSNPYWFSDLWVMADDGSDPHVLAVTPDVDEDVPDWLAPLT